MKKFALLFIFLLLTACAGTGDRQTLGLLGITSFQNEPEEFRGIKWGQSPTKIQGLRFIKVDIDGLASYYKEDDQLSLGEAKLKKIQYFFWKDKFVEVVITAAPDQLQALKNVLFEKYDKGYNPYGIFSPIHDYSWFGPIASVHLRRIVFNHDCEVWIKSREINDQLVGYRQNKAKQLAEQGAKKDF